MGSELLAQSKALQVPLKDTAVNKKTNDSVRVYYGKDTLHYAIKDRRGDFLSQPSNNPFDLSDTSVVKRRVDYDPATKTYSIADLIAGKAQRVPSTLTFDEFWKLKTAKDEQAYFMQRANSLGTLNRKMSRPKTKVYDSYFDRLFGKTGSDLKIDINNQLTDFMNEYGIKIYGYLLKDHIQAWKLLLTDILEQNPKEKKIEFVSFFKIGA